MNSIELKNVTKRLKGNTVLDDVTFTFESGSIYGLYGRNASGKTMLLRLDHPPVLSVEPPEPSILLLFCRS